MQCSLCKAMASKTVVQHYKKGTVAVFQWYAVTEKKVDVNRLFELKSETSFLSILNVSYLRQVISFYSQPWEILQVSGL